MNTLYEEDNEYLSKTTYTDRYMGATTLRGEANCFSSGKRTEGAILHKQEMNREFKPKAKLVFCNKTICTPQGPRISGKSVRIDKKYHDVEKGVYAEE